MSGQFLRSQVRIYGAARPGWINISTSDIPRFPETAAFWGNGSTILQSYESWDEAVAGHNQWSSNPRAVYERVIASVGQDFL